MLPISGLYLYSNIITTMVRKCGTWDLKRGEHKFWLHMNPSSITSSYKCSSPSSSSSSLSPYLSLSSSSSLISSISLVRRYRILYFVRYLQTAIALPIKTTIARDYEGNAGAQNNGQGWLWRGTHCLTSRFVTWAGGGANWDGASNTWKVIMV